MVAGCHVKPEQFFNLIFGYNDAYAETVSNLNANTGDNFLYGSVVPSGEVWVITALRGDNANRNIRIVLGYHDGTTVHWVWDDTESATRVSICWSGTLVLKAGSKAAGYFVGCTAGDDIYLDAFGYKMKLVQ